MGEVKATQITYHAGAVSRDERSSLLKQRGATLWFTGLSGSGKSTIAVALEQALIRRGHAAYVLDGDNVRFGLNASPKTLMENRGYSEANANRFGLTFAAADREENVRRIGEVARLFADAGLFALTSFISPYRKDRDAARAAHERGAGGAIPFIEVYMSTAIETCESRDPKGLYRQARAAVAQGKAAGFTGIDDPYEPPLNPDLTLDSGKMTVEESVAAVLNHLAGRGLLND